jgi:hypothetical protein
MLDSQRGEFGALRFLNTGGADFGGDLTQLGLEVSRRGVRRYPKAWDILNPLSGEAKPPFGALAVANDCFGGIFIWDGSQWDMYGTAHFANANDRAGVIPNPREGWTTRLTDRQRVEFFGSDNKWKCNPGTILASVKPQFDFVNSENRDAFAFGNGAQPLISAQILDPGVPYRVQISFTGEFGSSAAGTRWDLVVGVSSDGGVINDQILLHTMPEGRVDFIQVNSLPSHQVFQGTKYGVAQANRVNGTALGVLSLVNRNFWVQAVAA